MAWDSQSALRRRQSSSAGGTSKASGSLPSHTRQQSQNLILSKSTHVADPFLQDFLAPAFDPAGYLNAALPPLKTAGSSTAVSSSRFGKAAVPLADISAEAQTVLSQLSAHTTRLSTTLTQLTDDILRSGSRLAYEVELLRGEALSLAETLSDGLQADVAKFVPEGIQGEPETRVAISNTDMQEKRPSIPAAKEDAQLAHATTPTEPPYITQLRTLTLVRSRLESVIKTFGDAMEFVFPPSDLSVSSSFLSVSAPEPGAEMHSTEEKGQQVLQKLRDEISGLLSGDGDPIAGVEAATRRIEELKDLSVVWKGTAEEKGRARFIEGLAKMVEDRHKDLLREFEATRRDGARQEQRRGNAASDGSGAENRGYTAGYGFISQLQKIRSGL